MPGPARRHYSDRDKAMTLAFLDSNRGNFLKTQRATLIPAATIKYWDDQRHNQPEVTEFQSESRETVRALIEVQVRRMIASSPSKEGEASLKDTWVSIGIAVDKMAVLDEISAIGTAGLPAIPGTQRVNIQYIDPPAIGPVVDDDLPVDGDFIAQAEVAIDGQPMPPLLPDDEDQIGRAHV